MSLKRHNSFCRIELGEGLLSRVGEISREALPDACSAAVISDTNVFPLYGETLCASLENSGFEVTAFSFLAGEGSKTLATAEKIIKLLAEEGFSRSDAVFALGGGVVGDTAGFAASVYMRGMGLVQLPTTLMAAVDSSIGGKTGVDLDCGKNLVGSFYRPDIVICDTDIIKALPDGIFTDGMAEVIKYGAICDAELFSELEKNAPSRPSEKVIERCIELKLAAIISDEKDRGERRKLNFGHTLGHASELLSGYMLSHGSSVAAGEVAESRLAEALGICEKGFSERLSKLLASYGLPTELPFPIAETVGAALHDKKNSGGKIGFSLPDGKDGWSFSLLEPGQVIELLSRE